MQWHVNGFEDWRHSGMSYSCKVCGGQCRNRDNTVQQKKFREAFPEIVLPSACVVEADGTSRCPYDDR